MAWCYRAYWPIISSLWRNNCAPQNANAIYPTCFWEGLFTNESQDVIKQYLRFNLNENHDDDESDCINADDINDDDQDAHSSIDGDAEDSDEKDSQNSNNINKQHYS